MTKYLRQINLKEKQFILTDGLEGFKSIVYEPVVRQNNMAGNVWWSRAAYLMVARSKEGERGWCVNIPFKGMPPMTHFLQLGSAS
jgi:hypothetical protein